ncbi:MAG: hypothetical protein AMXMBFR34_14700 [Myxococcaceae bacterium]
MDGLKKAPSTTRRGISNGVSRFESAVQGAGKKVNPAQAREHKEVIRDLWNLRSALQTKDKAKALEQAKKLADRLHVAIGSGAKTAKQVLTLIGRQVISPDFTFKSQRDFHVIASLYRNPGGRYTPNDPDPTALSR